MRRRSSAQHLPGLRWRPVGEMDHDAVRPRVLEAQAAIERRAALEHDQRMAVGVDATGDIANECRTDAPLADDRAAVGGDERVLGVVLS